MPRTIEERLLEVRESLVIHEALGDKGFTDPANSYTATLLKKLLADLRIEGIAKRVIGDFSS